MGFVDDLKEAAGFGDEPGVEDSWKNRLEDAAYTPPSGIRITFDYENISYKIKKKTSAFEFPDADGTLVQDHGVAGRRFPWRIFFWGADYDKKAAVFEAALMERGTGSLETPLYGKHDVVPFGDITRRDDLKTAANQVIFEVTFFKTIGTAYPTGQEDAASAALTALDLFGSAGAAEFATSLKQGSVSEQQSLLDDLNGLVDDVGDQLAKIAAVQEVVNDQFEEIVATVDNIISTFIADPLTLAFKTQQMIQAPARALANIDDRLEGYGNLAGNIFGASNAVSQPGGPGGTGPQIGSNTGTGNDAQEPNRFHARNLFASTYVTGSILSSIYTDTAQGGASANSGVATIRNDALRTGVVGGKNKFQTAEQALLAAEAIFEQFDALIAWKDANYKSISGGNLSAEEQADFISSPTNMDQGGAQKHLTDAVALATGFLINMSFSLRRGNRFKLTRARSIVDLCYELYGTIDDETLDFFIDSNGLTCSKILELDKGQEIVYYV